MTIKDLGRWESLEMVQRYTRSVTFQDSMKFYKAPLSEGIKLNIHAQYQRMLFISDIACASSAAVASNRVYMSMQVEPIINTISIS